MEYRIAVLSKFEEAMALTDVSDEERVKYLKFLCDYVFAIVESDYNLDKFIELKDMAISEYLTDVTIN